MSSKISMTPSYLQISRCPAICFRMWMYLHDLHVRAVKPWRFASEALLASLPRGSFGTKEKTSPKKWPNKQRESGRPQMLEKNSNRNSFSRLPDRSCDGRHCIIPRAACRLLKPWGKPIFKNNSCHLSTLSAESQVIDKDSTGCGESRYARGRVLLIWNHFENSVTCFFVNALWQQTFKPLLTNVFEINKPLGLPRDNHDVFGVHASPVLSRCKQSFVRCWKRKKK